MGAIKTVLSELLALFVDDGSLVLAVIAWAVVGAICLRAHLLDPASAAVLLAVGIAVLLAENVGRTASAHASNSGSR
jgi:hypothetical protein